MSNVPKNRDHLIELIESKFEKLTLVLTTLSEEDSQLLVDDDFSVKDIVALRVWWSNAVYQWVTKGRKGESFAVPDKHYGWRETPALNRRTARENQAIDLKKNMSSLKRNKTKLIKLVSSLDDDELTKVGVYEWAGKWPIMRWISMGSSSQFDSATKLIRTALKKASRE